MADKDKSLKTVGKPAGTPSSPSSSNDIADFVRKVGQVARPAGAKGRGRLLFALDATMSRQPTWDLACSLQAEMFKALPADDSLSVQLLDFRGLAECRASKWVSEPSALAPLMTGVDCRGGNTQIGKVLSHIKAEAGKAKVNAVVYVGDAMEENIDALCGKAGEIGMLGIPIFMFQEGSDASVAIAYREIARLTRGAYLRLDGSSAHALRELLSAVAVYAAGGRQALENHSRAKGGGATLLLEQLR
jgi:hypothetical protein